MYVADLVNVLGIFGFIFPFQASFFVPTDENIELTGQHVLQSTSNYLGRKDNTKPLFFVIQAEPLHIILIGYFNKLCRQLKDIGPLSLFIQLSPLIIPSLK